MEENNMSGGYPKYLPRREPYSFRIYYDDLKKLKEYAKMKRTEPSTLLNEIVHEFLEDKVLVNDFLPDKLGFVLPLFTDLELKQQILNKDITSFMDEKHLKKWLRRHTENKLVDTVSYETTQIPNNLDVWTGDTFKSTIEGIDHEGILPVIVPQVFLENDDVTVEDLVYFLDIQVVNNQYRIIPVASTTAINKLRLNDNIKMMEQITQSLSKLKEVLKEDSGIDKIYIIADKYNVGELTEVNVELDDTNKIEPRQAVTEIIMKTDMMQKMVDSIMEDEKLMSNIQKLIEIEKM